MDLAEPYRRPPLAQRSKALLLVSTVATWAAAAVILLYDELPPAAVVALVALLGGICAWASVAVGRDARQRFAAVVERLRAQAPAMSPEERSAALAALERAHGKNDLLRELRADLDVVPGAVVDPPREPFLPRTVPGGWRLALVRGVVAPVAAAAGITALVELTGEPGAGAEAATWTFLLVPVASYLAGQGTGVHRRERRRLALLAMVLAVVVNAGVVGV